MNEHLEGRINREEASWFPLLILLHWSQWPFRAIFAQCAKFRSPIQMHFTDFEMTFNRINKKYVCSAPANNYYRSAICKMLSVHHWEVSQEFQVQIGVWKGFILPPISFLAIIGDILLAPLAGRHEEIQWTLSFCLNSSTTLKTSAHFSIELWTFVKCL